jgi:hypothetical protein
MWRATGFGHCSSGVLTQSMNGIVMDIETAETFPEGVTQSITSAVSTVKSVRDDGARRFPYRVQRFPQNGMAGDRQHLFGLLLDHDV